jgi:hypothetical protein
MRNSVDVQHIVKLSYQYFSNHSNEFSKETLIEIDKILISPDEIIPLTQNTTGKIFPEFLTFELLKQNNFKCDTYIDERGHKIEYYYKSFQFTQCYPHKQKLYIKIATSNSASRINNILKELLKDLSLLYDFQPTLVLCVNNSIDNTLSTVLDCVSCFPFDLQLFYIHCDQFSGLHKRQKIASANNLIYHHISTKCQNQPEYWVGLDDDIQLGDNSYSKIGLLIKL